MTGPVRVLLMGNPNVGKSTVFNCLTGLRQHTGNWPGKTVAVAQGRYRYEGREYLLEDLPGTYSLATRSREEQVAREALERGDFDCVAVVCDGTCLRRNLILVYQVLRLVHRVVVVVNLMDEASRRGISVDGPLLEQFLGVPVVCTAASQGAGLERVKAAIQEVCAREPHPAPVPEGRRERAALAEKTAGQVVSGRDRGRERQIFWDRLLTGRKTGFPLMLLLLFFVLWLTVAGANVPSQWLWKAFKLLYEALQGVFASAPWWLRGAVLDGMLLTAGRVIAVMLPPMAIFFPLFTLLEELGYLPRVAYNLDHALSRCGGCGKMGLTMCMGLGCNAVGVTGCRIIDSPRERIMAVLTNSFVPCNGRFGALLVLFSAFLIPAGGDSALGALGLTAAMVLGVLASMGACWMLSRTVLKGYSSAFTLELPPFRRPRVGQILLRSVLDRTLKVLGRAAVVALPAGLLLWVLGAIPAGEGNLLTLLSGILDPLGSCMGLSGGILLAFFLGFPANELILPIVLMIGGGGTLLAADTGTLAVGLGALGFTTENALCTAVLLLFHWPCATTCLTIHRETGSLKWTLWAVLLPTALGVGLCLLIHGCVLLM